MGITLASNFDVNAALPLDSRMVVADVTARDAIVAGRRFQGMCVYVVADVKTYQLQGGILNINWVEFGSGNAASFVEKFSGNGVLTAFTLANNPLAIENTQVYIDGVYQQKTIAYTLSTNVITFTSAPPTGTNNIEVTYTTPTSASVIPDNYITAPKLASDSVTTAKILDGSVTKAKLASVGQQVSSSVTSFTTSSTTPVDVTSLSVTITSTGRPIIIILQTTPTPFGYLSINGSGSNDVYIKLMRDATLLSTSTLTNTGSTLNVPVSSTWMDVPTAGTYVYKIQMSVSSVSATGTINGVKLSAYEL